MRAINDRIFIRRASAHKTSAMGLQVIDHSKTNQGEIVAAGPTSGFERGQQVVFAQDKKGARHEVVVIDHQELLALRAADVIAVLED